MWTVRTSGSLHALIYPGNSIKICNNYQINYICFFFFHFVFSSQEESSKWETLSSVKKIKSDRAQLTFDHQIIRYFFAVVVLCFVRLLFFFLSFFLQIYIFISFLVIGLLCIRPEEKFWKRNTKHERNNNNKTEINWNLFNTILNINALLSRKNSMSKMSWDYNAHSSEWNAFDAAAVAAAAAATMAVVVMRMLETHRLYLETVARSFRTNLHFE